MAGETLTIDATGRVLAVGKKGEAGTMSRNFTRGESLLLEWLSKEDQSALGECHCEDLWHLVGEGLVNVDPVEGAPWQYAHVFLTDSGWEARKKMAPANDDGA